MGMKTRRSFLQAASAVSVGFGGLGKLCASLASQTQLASTYGELVPDRKGILDLPKGFHYKILSATGDEMADGWQVPAQPDGMAAFDAPDGRSTVVVRNHELWQDADWEYGPFPTGKGIPESAKGLCYGIEEGETPFAGGTTTLVYNPVTQCVHTQFLSLVGTNRNCAGGPTPWGSWVSCEEPSFSRIGGGRAQRHGYCFEVFPTLTPRLQRPRPLPAWGRFKHEAIAVDPKTGIVYLTEDTDDGLLYRFVPKDSQTYQEGQLQALMISDRPKDRTRTDFPGGVRFKVEWVDLEDPLSPGDTLRDEGFEQGAAQFTRGEGIWYGQDAIYFACTNGGRIQGGQVWRYFPASEELELFLEPNDYDLLKNCDNLTVADWGDLFICEDLTSEARKYSQDPPMIRGVTPDGQLYTFARNALNDNEFAGVCFAPNHPTMFVNIQTPGITFAITGPWDQRVA